MTDTSKGLPPIFRPKLSHSVARFLCESWATCANCSKMQHSPSNWITHYKLVVCKSAMHMIWNLYKNIRYVILLCYTKYTVSNDVMDVTEVTRWVTNDIKSKNTCCYINKTTHCLLDRVFATNININTDMLRFWMAYLCDTVSSPWRFLSQRHGVDCHV